MALVLLCKMPRLFELRLIKISCLIFYIFIKDSQHRLVSHRLTLAVALITFSLLMDDRIHRVGVTCRTSFGSNKLK